VQTDTTVVREGESHFGMRQRDTLDRLGTMGEFGVVGLEEFSACRRVVIEVAHFDDGPDGQRGRFWRRCRFGGEPPGMLSGAGLLSAGQGDAGDGRYRGQGFATKTERADTFEIVKRADLRGRMAGQGQCQFDRVRCRHRRQ
jgi:hypothetical protein